MVTTHIQKMIRTALDIAERADVLSDGVKPSQPDIEGAINKLHHAALELEAEMLSKYRGVPQD